MTDLMRERIRQNYLAEEGGILETLVKLADLRADERSAISSRAEMLVQKVRAHSEPQLMEAFLGEYGLSTGEGVALMCLAEALLRVPDADTIDELIRDKIAPHDWSAHSGESGSIFVNASTWALMLTGKVLDEGEGGIERTLRGMVRRLGEPVIRRAVAAAMREMGDNFVLGRNIGEAIKRGRTETRKGYLYSYDMLGEAARTDADALRYHRAYADAIAALAVESKAGDVRRNPGISVKLSAIHPRYERLQHETMLPVMRERLLTLALAAKNAGMGLNIDAEEADRLDISLDVIESVLADPSLAGWEGFGVVVQAYGKRAEPVLDWLYALAERLDRKIMVRLVKGAYWDTEIKRAQVLGLSGYPVFTRKPSTDVSYIACARKLLSMTDRIYPQFATHNAHTVAAILHMATDREAFEFQRLHGMGDALHETVRKSDGTRCRIYAPVGAHSDLLAYLVRRLLENGANSSFVHQIVDDEVSASEIARDPFDYVAQLSTAHNSALPMPAEIFGKARMNARGWDVTDPDEARQLVERRDIFAHPHAWHAGNAGTMRAIRNPADNSDIVGKVCEVDATIVRDAVARAADAAPVWAARPVSARAEILRRAADLYEVNAPEFLALATREAGKTIHDGIAEVREAVDFLRYYALQAKDAEKVGGPRGVIACISPWNFPLAIFTGQIAAALATGNVVVAKPAEQTPLIAARAVELLHEAGVPQDALQLLPGDGPNVGAPLTADPRIAGVCFTGSTDVARLIERQLARTAAPDAMLIAETGGLNAMIVDSTALAEQAIRDVVASAFQSAGQRCSALRMLYLQKDIEPHFLEMLKGAMMELQLADPWPLATDIGPVIDEEARAAIVDYCRQMEDKGRLIARLEAPSDGLFVAPHIFRVSGISEMKSEVFGPVLHVAAFEADDLDEVISQINATGYGLTFGLHTRIDARVQHIIDRVQAGNIYVNRNQIGAVVGAQPFGGEGLSGTGPKAGGPNYLRRFRKVTIDQMQSDSAPSIGLQSLKDNLPNPGGWASRSDRVSVLRKHLRGKGAEAVSAAASLDQGPYDLPGPTGEANTLALLPRGCVLCLGPDAEALIAQVVQALAVGNSVLAVAPQAASILRSLTSANLPIAALSGSVTPSDLSRLDIDAVAFVGDADTKRHYRQALADRQGPIVRLIDETIYPAAYALERAVCVDTTAAGGNASLLAAAE